MADERDTTARAEASRRMLRFLAVGGWNTAVGYGIFVALAFVFGERLHHQVLLAASFSISVVHAYFLQRWLVFRSRGAKRQEFPRFVVVNLGALALNAVILEILVRLSLHLMLAQLVAILAATLLSFVAHQLWSFRTRR